jgi:hypothetical protein
MFVREKTARGHTYLYLVESVREGGRVRHEKATASGVEARAFSELTESFWDSQGIEFLIQDAGW